MSLRPKAVAAALIAFCVSFNRSASQQPDVKSIAANVRNSLESIRSLHLKVEIQSSVISDQEGEKDLPAISLEWWQDGESIKWVEDQLRERKTPEDPVKARMLGLVKDGKLRTLLRAVKADGSEKDSQATTRDYDSSQIIAKDVWVLGLFAFQSSQQRATLAELLDKGERVRVVESPGSKQDLVEIFVPAPPPATDFGYEIVLDPSVNYLVRSMTTKGPATSMFDVKRNVLKFQEPVPGIYFPAEIQTTAIGLTGNRKGQVIQRAATKFYDVQINKSIDPAVFELKYGPRIPVLDRTKNAQFITDDNGQPSGKPVPAPDRAITKTLPTYKKATGTSSLWSFLAVISATVCVIGVTLQLWKRRHSKTAG